MQTKPPTGSLVESTVTTIGRTITLRGRVVRTIGRIVVIDTLYGHIEVPHCRMLAAVAP